MKRMSFKEFLVEAPIVSYNTVGDFNKGSSFTDKRDRVLLTNPRSVERTMKKFANNTIDFNFIFVNNKYARQYTEVGEVTHGWVEKNLGEEAYKMLEKTFSRDAVNVIFTNNKGAERFPMTPWIIAHRLGHVIWRDKNNWHPYNEASTAIVETLANILEECYIGRRLTASNHRDMIGRGYRSTRADQLAMKNFFQHAATFRSAREGIIRDWFEVLNELIAQYLTTGTIKFNNAPESFRAAGATYRLKPDEVENANDYLQGLARTMEIMIDDIFSYGYGKIFVM